MEVRRVWGLCVVLVGHLGGDDQKGVLQWQKACPCRLKNDS